MQWKEGKLVRLRKSERWTELVRQFGVMVVSAVETRATMQEGMKRKLQGRNRTIRKKLGESGQGSTRGVSRYKWRTVE
jgi:hypothetical protein